MVVFRDFINVYFSKSVVHNQPKRLPINRSERSRADGICHHRDASPFRKREEDQDRRSTVCLTRQSGSATPGRSAHLSRVSHASSQSIHRRPTVILFVQINNEIAAAPHRGTRRVVIAAFQAGSDGLCGRLARLHCDLVCVCNFPQA